MHERKPFHGQILWPSFSFIHQGYYKRTPDYLPIYNRERVGCFQVPVVHSTVLIDLRSQRSDASRQLAYWPAPEGFKGPVDDVVQFAFSAKKEGALWRAAFCYNLKSWFIVESSWNWMFPTKPLVHLDEHQQWVCLLYSRMCSLPKKEILIHCSGATLVVENSPTFAPWYLPSFMQSYSEKLDENLEMTLNQFHSSPQFYGRT